MEDQLRNLLNQKMEGLQAKSLAPTFSVLQSWSELEHRLQEKRGRKLVPIWWAYAASLLLGIIIGGAAIYYNKREPSASLTKLTIEHVLVPEQKKTIQDVQAIAVEPRISLSIKRKEVKSTEKANTQASRIIGIAPESEIQEPAPVKEEEVKVVKVVQRRQVVERALHILDIESEDKTVLLDEPKTTHYGSSFTLYISPKLRLQGGNDAQAPASVIRTR
jgi:hypothetical protein